MGHPILMRPGDQYAFLTYVKEVEPYVTLGGQKRRKCLWQCSCGSVLALLLGNVRAGDSKSCGCHKNTSHGLVGTSVYRCWNNMRQRCYNPNNPMYTYYGGRGIAVCESWVDFRAFYKDMGPKPSNSYEIDRKNNDGDYTPENCHWTLATSNCQNTRRAKRWHIQGKLYMSITDASSRVNISKTSVLRWCNGYIDKGKRYPPKPGCYSYLAYSKEKTI